jgi:hypothetical protein
MKSSTGLKSMFGRSNGRRMLFLAGAVAAYAWRSRSRARRAGGAPSRRAGDAPGAGDAGARGPDRFTDSAAGHGHTGAGITDLPPAAEGAQQSSLPPRGQRKEGVHA